MSHPDCDASPHMPIAVAFRPVALRWVLVRQRVGADATVTRVLPNGRSVDLHLHFDAGEFVDVTVERPVDVRDRRDEGMAYGTIQAAPETTLGYQDEGSAVPGVRCVLGL